MGPEDQDSLNVTGSAGAGDQGSKAREIIAVPDKQQLKGCRQVRHELVGLGHDHMMRGEHRQGAAARATRRQKDRTGLGYQASQAVMPTEHLSSDIWVRTLLRKQCFQLQ